MTDLILMKKKMEKLRLGGMLMTYEQRLHSAQEERWSYSSLMDTLLTDEVEKRKMRS
jgi:hypothetical protein